MKSKNITNKCFHFHYMLHPPPPRLTRVLTEVAGIIFPVLHCKLLCNMVKLLYKYEGVCTAGLCTHES